MVSNTLNQQDSKSTNDLVAQFRKMTSAREYIAKKALSQYKWVLDDAVKAYNANPDQFKTGKKKKGRRKMDKPANGKTTEETQEESTAPEIEESKSDVPRDKDKMETIYKRYAGTF